MLNPAVPGFHPDPSVVRVGDEYWLACSTFEYFPGIPIFHSTDAEHWELSGHVATRPGQLDLAGVPTGGGVWAPTIRHHDGRFWLVVADAMGRGPLVFSAADARGPWSDGTPMVGVDGIDHDLAWDDDGTCYVTYSGLILTPEEFGVHKGILQARVDLATGRALEEPRSLWSGTGLKFPEAPHLYHVDGRWYLMIAEGGTERGHSVSIARGDSPAGPFEGHPRNPIHSHRSTSHPVQNAGHADLVRTDDGWVMVMLGTRPGGVSQMFAPMGRETFATRVTWADGWPVVEPFELTPGRPGVVVETSFDGPLGPEWLSVRDAERAWAAHQGGALVLTAAADVPVAMDAPAPRFLGRRQQHTRARFTTVVDTADGSGGLSVRYDERHHYDVEAGGGAVVARVRLDQIEHTWSVPTSGNVVEVWLEAVPPTSSGFGLDMLTCDVIRMGFGSGADEVVVAEMDGRYLTSEVTSSFTGRVAGVYAASGRPAFRSFRYEGSDD